jgi:hypothetical protein
MAQMSTLSASAATAAGVSKQRRAPPAPPLPLSQCANSPLGCSTLDYEALLADALGLLYNCTRRCKVDNIRFILDVWSRQRLHLACANGHTGLVQLLLSFSTTNVVSNGLGNPRLDKFKVEDNKRTSGQHNERMRGQHDKRRHNNQSVQDDKRASE